MIKDSKILLSVVNTFLRDGKGSLEDFAYENNCEIAEIHNALNGIIYL